MSISKRCRNDIDLVDLDRRPLFILPEHANSLASPQSFTPICLVSRSQLPLAYLDTAFPGSRLFHAHLNILEACHEVGEGGNVLIIQDEIERRLYAVERTQFQRYALCRLASWVHCHHISQCATAHAVLNEPPVKRHVTTKLDEERPWWASLHVELPKICRDNNSSSVPMLEMKTDGLSNTKHDGACEAETTQTPNNNEPQSILGHHPSNDNSVMVPSTASEVLAELSKQYLDALYLSRTSLAFFSKGPLSRARVALSAESNTDLHQAELTEFLRGVLLNSAIMDKKFREAIAEVVYNLPTEVSTKPKKKRRWKPKRDKSGFFNDEKEYIESWWRKCDEKSNATSSAETLETLWKKRAPGLRNREAYLQVILMLEVLALEKAAPGKETVQTISEPQMMEREDSQAENSEKTRKRKAIDVGEMLSNLLDRITIWHSLEMVSPSKIAQAEVGKDEVNDDLKDFCVEVVLPFYVSRIPEHAAFVNRKLGGPDIVTSTKRKHSSSLRKPGQPAVRQVPGQRPRKPLGRVATVSLERPSKPATLTRSATDPDALIKREHSGAAMPMKNIPAAKTRSARLSAVQSISFNKREVDLSALHNANEEKMRKKAEIQEKLIEAIGAIKKPQRSIKDIAQQTDDSFAKAISKAKSHSNRKTLEKPGQMPTTLSHIKATPSHRRVQPLAAHVEDPGVDISVVPSSVLKLPPNILAVPQTGHRCRIGSPSALLESPTIARTGPVAVIQTPTRPLRLSSLNTPSVAPTKSEQGLNDFSAKNQGSIYDMWNEEYEELA